MSSIYLRRAYGLLCLSLSVVLSDRHPAGHRDSSVCSMQNHAGTLPAEQTSSVHRTASPYSNSDVNSYTYSSPPGREPSQNNRCAFRTSHFYPCGNSSGYSRLNRTPHLPSYRIQPDEDLNCDSYSESNSVFEFKADVHHPCRHQDSCVAHSHRPFSYSKPCNVCTKGLLPNLDRPTGDYTSKDYCMGFPTIPTAGLFSSDFVTGVGCACGNVTKNNLSSPNRLSSPESDRPTSLKKLGLVHTKVAEHQNVDTCDECPFCKCDCSGDSNKSTFGSSELPSDISSCHSSVYRAHSPKHRDASVQEGKGPPSPHLSPHPVGLSPLCTQRSSHKLPSASKRDTCFSYCSIGLSTGKKCDQKAMSNSSLGSIETRGISPNVSDWSTDSGSEEKTACPRCSSKRPHVLPGIVTYASSGKEITYKFPSSLKQGDTELKFVSQNQHGRTSESSSRPQVSCGALDERLFVNQGCNIRKSSEPGASSMQNCVQCYEMRNRLLHHGFTQMEPPAHVFGQQGKLWDHVIHLDQSDTVQPRQSIVVYSQPEGTKNCMKKE